MASRQTASGVWSADEHNRFLDALRFYPEGPWTALADHVGSRSPRQVQTHAQKYYEKMRRHARGLLRDRRAASAREHRVDEAIFNAIAAVTKARAGDKNHNGNDRSRSSDASAPPCLVRLCGGAPSSARVQPMKESNEQDELQLMPLNCEVLTAVQEADFNFALSLLEAFPPEEHESVSNSDFFSTMTEQVAIV